LENDMTLGGSVEAPETVMSAGAPAACGKGEFE